MVLCLPDVLFPKALRLGYGLVPFVGHLVGHLSNECCSATEALPSENLLEKTCLLNWARVKQENLITK
ncbi:MAG: hypothetical protein AAFP20_12580 [Cyanobacteria bacterium J06614_10]